MRGYVLMLGILAASWGASYLFIKVAVEDLEPAPMMCLRLILAFAALFPVLALRLGLSRRGLCDPRNRPGRRAARPDQHGHPVHAHRLGREARGLGRGRDRELDGADLRRAPRHPLPPERARDRDAPLRRSPRAPRASASSPGSTPRAAGGRSPGRSRSSSPRSPMRAPISTRRRASGARSRSSWRPRRPSGE